MVLMLTITYPFMPPPELRGNSRSHWRAKNAKKKEFQELTFWYMHQQNEPLAEPMDKVTIKYTAYYCGRPIDIDNLITGMKYAQDCLTIQGIIPDDSPDHIKNVSVEYHRVKHKRQVQLVMEVTEVD
jgi:Holliday junction resolvase RusA-like endonuclease